MVEKNYIKVDEKMKTNINGIYACGDCVGGLLQISKSVYEGTIAGLEVIKYVKFDAKPTWCCLIFLNNKKYLGVHPSLGGLKVLHAWRDRKSVV